MNVSCIEYFQTYRRKIRDFASSSRIVRRLKAPFCTLFGIKYTHVFYKHCFTWLHTKNCWSSEIRSVWNQNTNSALSRPATALYPVVKSFCIPSSIVRCVYVLDRVLVILSNCLVPMHANVYKQSSNACYRTVWQNNQYSIWLIRRTYQRVILFWHLHDFEHFKTTFLVCDRSYAAQFFDLAASYTYKHGEKQ